MWQGLFQVVADVTGKHIALKPFSPNHAGIRAILLDGCKPQADALGDFLVQYNNPDLSGVCEKDPRKIVEYILKLCSVHFDRCVESV